MSKKMLPFLAMLLLPALVPAQQQTTEYPDDYLSPAFHANRREAVRNMLPKNSVALFFAAQVRSRNNDNDYLYAQNKNFYYLTGLDEPNSLLLIFKEPVTILDKTGTEFLFVQPRNPQREMWTGKILGVDGVKNLCKMDNVFLHTQFSGSVINLDKMDSVFSNFHNEEVVFAYYANPRSMDPLSKMAMSVDSAVNARKAAINSRLVVNIMRTLRGVKQPEEIALIRKAASISTDGHAAVMRSVKPGMTEYQAQAIMEYYFKKEGSEYPGYPSINGSGPNSCTLHYESNRRLTKDGDLLLSDCAAEYHGYSADVTRTIPVNGKFSPEQKIIYNLVLESQDSAFAFCKPGNASNDPHKAATRVIARGLVKLGIIAAESDVKTYFTHSTSHGLGLDVHDPNAPVLQQGSVFTVEPGIYIPAGSKCDSKWWNIGVRIEDDIVITKDGYENLSAGAPRTVAEIEKLAKEKSIFK